MIKVYKNAIQEVYRVNLKELGLTFLEFNPLSLESELGIENVEGADGGTITSNQFKERQIQAKLYLRTKNNIDFQNKKSDVYKLFNSRQELLIVDERLDTKKVWRVRTDGSSYNLENDQTTYTKEFELTFISESSFATALNDTKTVITTQTGFLMNAGDVYLDAREHNIDVHFYGNSDKLRIVNETTGTQWQYKGTTTLQDKIYIDSIYPYKNNINIFEDTNYGVLEFVEGSNKIKMYGVTGDYSLIIKHHDLYI